MGKFDLAYGFTRVWEKGTSNHPKDPGGLTKNGITLGFFMGLVSDPSMRKALDVNEDGVVDREDLLALTDEQCSAIYQSTFWRWVKGEQLPLYAAICTFDMAVHSGPKIAIKTLQRAYSAAVGEYIKDDGILGPMTLGVVGNLGQEGLTNLAHRYLDLRLQFLRGLNNDAMIKGWVNRIESTARAKLGLRAYIMELYEDGIF